jgi:ferredoxin
MRRQPYKFSQAEIDRHTCNDCGVNVIRIGDYCLIEQEIWKDQQHLKWTDNLCISCVEKRLGRKTTWADFYFLPPCVEGFPMSALLTERLDWAGRVEKQKQHERKRKRKLERDRSRRRRAAARTAA